MDFCNVKNLTMSKGWKEKGQKLAYTVLNPLINAMVKYGVTPNMITVLGLILNILATIIFIYGAETALRGDHRTVGWGGFIILVAGLMDMIDGRLARVGNTASKSGALFDSVLDRFSEMFMFLGICYYLVENQYFLSSLFAFIAMTGSIMVSYTRARAEGLGVQMADVGLMQRPERIILIGGSALFCGIFSGVFGSGIKVSIDALPFPLFETITIFTFPLFLLSLMANYTALDRLKSATKILDKE